MAQTMAEHLITEFESPVDFLLFVNDAVSYIHSQLHFLKNEHTQNAIYRLQRIAEEISKAWDNATRNTQDKVAKAILELEKVFETSHISEAVAMGYAACVLEYGTPAAFDYYTVEGHEGMSRRFSILVELVDILCQHERERVLRNAKATAV